MHKCYRLRGINPINILFKQDKAFSQMLLIFRDEHINIGTCTKYRFIRNREDDIHLDHF